MESAMIRAERGAELLDEWEPGWVEKVDLSILNLDDGCRCILGQIYARHVGLLSGDLRPENGYEYGVELLMVDSNDEAFGFCPMEDPGGRFSEDTRALDEAWIAIVKRRRGEAS